MFERSTSAYERALALDPGFSDAAGQLITNRVERGELGRAYEDAKGLVAKHPENAVAHFALSYVLRYGGMLREAAPECNAARSLDPGNYQFRSCSLVFDLMGDTERGMEFLRLDLGSRWVSVNLPLHFERAGQPAEARASAKKIPPDDATGKLLIACFDPTQAAKLDTEISAAMPAILADPDPENRYWSAALMARCGKPNIAIRLLKSAIEGHYCAHTALQSDALLVTLRGTPEFSKLLSGANQCENNFLSEGTRESR
jgi:tetratricopeptide (TPR) repeat protein